MTTNVADFISSQLTSDSRWSIPGSSFTVYVDDTGFDKILPYGRHAFIFAGLADVIQAWKVFIKNAQEGMPFPDPTGMAVSIIDTLDNKSIYSFGDGIDIPGARFAGSGAIHALHCWTSNKCPRIAVESAKKMDIYSGGEVKYLHLSSGVTNVNISATTEEIKTGIIQRGMVMYNTSAFSTEHKQQVPIQDAAANDPSVRDILSQVASGELSASAPCSAMYNTWSNEDLSNLSKAISTVIKQR